MLCAITRWGFWGAHLVCDQRRLLARRHDGCGPGPPRVRRTVMQQEAGNVRGRCSRLDLHGVVRDFLLHSLTASIAHLRTGTRRGLTCLVSLLPCPNAQRLPCFLDQSLAVFQLSIGSVGQRAFGGRLAFSCRQFVVRLCLPIQRNPFACAFCVRRSIPFPVVEIFSWGYDVNRRRCV